MFKKNSILEGAIILTFAGLITRVIGFVYRIYLSNLIGTVGMGIYQLIFPIYSLLYTVSCSGIQIAISKIVASEYSRKNYKNIYKTVTLATLLSVLIAAALSVVIYANVDMIGISLFKEERSILSLKILIIATPFMAISSCLKGYFLGLKSTAAPALSQLIEQIAKVIIIYLFAGLFINKGIAYACAMAVVGMVGGEVISCFWMIISYYLAKKKQIPNPITKEKPSRYILKKILAITIPLTTSKLLISVLHSIEAILIPGRLRLFGMSHSDSLSIYGILTGMALPLILFPSVFTNALSVMLLPTISEAQAQKSVKQIHFTTTKTLKYSIIIGIISSFIFIAFGQELGNIIFNNQEVGKILVILAWLCPFMYINTTLHSILNGLGYTVVSLRNNVIGLVLRILFILFVIPISGIRGYLWGLLASYLVITLLDILKIIQITKISFDVVNWLIKPLLAATITSLFMYQIYIAYIDMLNIPDLIGVVFICGLMTLVYFAFLKLMGCVSFRDVKPNA